MRIDEIKRASLTSTIGAGVLGAGIGLIFARFLETYTTAILILGLITHSWGMYHSHRLQAEESTPTPRWAEWIYWACWIGLAGLLMLVIAKSV